MAWLHLLIRLLCTFITVVTHAFYGLYFATTSLICEAGLWASWTVRVILNARVRSRNVKLEHSASKGNLKFSEWGETASVGRGVHEGGVICFTSCSLSNTTTPMTDGCIQMNTIEGYLHASGGGTKLTSSAHEVRARIASERLGTTRRRGGLWACILQHTL